MYYAVNKLKARIKRTTPTVTDQSQAKATDLNVIVKKFGVTSNIGSMNANPMFGQDTTNWPRDLREVFETARDLHRARAQLPEQLQNLTLAELVQLTDEQLQQKLTPPKEPPKEPPKDPPAPNEPSKEPSK